MRSIYHFLSRALGQQVSISQVVDFDVLNEVAVGNIHVGLHLIVAWLVGLLARRPDRGDIHMLGSLSRLQLRIDLGSGGSYFAWLARCNRKLHRAFAPDEK